MKKLLLFIYCLLCLMAVQAQKVFYKVSFPNAIHHEAHIELTVSPIPVNNPAIFKMSRSSPGRYATHEFGKNIYDVSAKGKNGEILAVKRIDGDVYQVSKHNGTITISYTLFGNYADGTYAGIDPESIHLNMPACFMWMKNMDNAPIEIQFDLPKENKGVIATQLIPTANPHVFRAPGLQYFMDSPTKIGDLTIREWPIENNDGKKFTMRIALEANATNAQADELADKVKKLVEEEREVFGEFPRYDYGSYTFLASINSYVKGDGMEHRNSTMITLPISDFKPANVLSVFAHEYFHNWNVERIRPKTLEPFNFEKSNMSHELWCAEGFTQYYGELLLTRAGLTDQKSHLGFLAGLVNAKLNSPGGKFYSPVDASNHAVFVDAAVSIDRNNYGNMFTSYYTYGAAIALALDLELQTRYHKTLDAFMQAMWKRFGKTEIPYTLSTMEETLASITDGNFAHQFFSQYISGHAPIDYANLLSKAGYNIINTSAGRPSIGASLQFTESGKTVISNNTIKGSAAYEAGLDIGDEIMQLDNTYIKSAADLSNFLQQKKPGDKIVITFQHRKTITKTTLSLHEQVSLSLQPVEDQGNSVTATMKAIRNSWFNSKVN